MADKQDNIMRDADGQPVNVPAPEQPKIMKDAQGNPVVPSGTEEPGSDAPKDTLARPTPNPQMPSNQETTVPETTQETVESQAPEGTTYEELAAKKGFKSPDDLARSYENLESQDSRVTATLADAMKARTDGAVAPTADINEAVKGADTQEDALKIVNSLIDKRVNAVEDKYEYQMYIMQNPEAKQLAPQAIQYVRDNPGIKWEVAFKAAKADSLGSSVEQAREQGRQEAYKSKETKESSVQAMHTSQGQGAGEVLGIKEAIDRIKTGKMPLSEARQLINQLQQ